MTIVFHGQTTTPHRGKTQKLVVTKSCCPKVSYSHNAKHLGDVDMQKNEVKRCPSCGSEMKFAFAADFRFGASELDMPGLELPQNNEGLLPLDVFVCSSCGKIDFYAGPEIKQSLLNIADKQRSR